MGGEKKGDRFLERRREQARGKTQKGVGGKYFLPIGAWRGNIGVPH